MKTLFKIVLVLGLAMMAFSSILGFSVLGFLSDLPHGHLTIDGNDFMWSGMDLADAFGAGLGLMIAFLVMCLVVPLVLLLGLGLPLLILGGLLLAGIVALLSVGAVLGAPAIFVGLIVWLLVRDKPRKPVAPPPAATQATSPSLAAGPAAPTEPSLT
jgi:hypothetical protein